MTDKVVPVTRHATGEEYERMGAWYRWAYDHGLFLALWADNEITLLAEGKEGHVAVLAYSVEDMREK